MSVAEFVMCVIIGTIVGNALAQLVILILGA